MAVPNTTSDSTTPQHRLYRFSLQTLIVVLTLVAVICTWLGVAIDSARRASTVDPTSFPHLPLATVEKIDPTLIWQQVASGRGNVSTGPDEASEREMIEYTTTGLTDSQDLKAFVDKLAAKIDAEIAASQVTLGERNVDVTDQTATLSFLYYSETRRGGLFISSNPTTDGFRKVRWEHLKNWQTPKD